MLRHEMLRHDRNVPFLQSRNIPQSDLEKEVGLGRTKMSQEAMHRVEVPTQVKREQLQVADAVPLLRVSYRPATRLWKRFREDSNAVRKGTFPNWIDAAQSGN
jgi:hypothetical protein